MRRQARRTRGARQHDAQDVGMLVVRDKRPKREQIGCRLRSEPLGDVSGRLIRNALARLEAPERLTQVVLQREQVVSRCLDAHQQAVERRKVDPRRLPPALQRLHERRARAGERVEHTSARRHVAAQQLFDELRDELPEVGVQTVDVLRPLPLWKLLLGPRELEVELRIERVLGCSHETEFAEERTTPRTLLGGTEARARARRRRRNAPRSPGTRDARPATPRRRTSRAASSPPSPPRADRRTASRTSTSPRRRRPCARGAATRSSS